jgi:hypothetical protein
MFRTSLATLAFSIASCGVAAAQSLELNWHTIDGGGGRSSNSTGGLILSGTFGQPDAGATMTGGPFALTGGFWAGAVPPSAPCVGDLDGDKQVGQSDLGILLASYSLCPGQPGYSPAAGALAGDPCVTQADLGVLLASYGTLCP